MGFSAPPLLQHLIFLFILTFASLSCIGKASKLSLLQIREPSLQSDTTGSLYWKVMRSRLRRDAQEEKKDLLETLHQLEKEVQEPPKLEREKLEDPLRMLDSGLSPGEKEEKEEEREERHPADELLQRLHADATISYILGGY